MFRFAKSRAKQRKEKRKMKKEEKERKAPGRRKIIRNEIKLLKLYAMIQWIN